MTQEQRGFSEALVIKNLKQAVSDENFDLIAQLSEAFPELWRDVFNELGLKKQKEFCCRLEFKKLVAGGNSDSLIELFERFPEILDFQNEEKLNISQAALKAERVDVIWDLIRVENRHYRKELVLSSVLSLFHSEQGEPSKWAEMIALIPPEEVVSKFNLNTQDQYGRTLIFAALQAGDQEAVLALIEAGVNVDFVVRFGENSPEQNLFSEAFFELEDLSLLRRLMLASHSPDPLLMKISGGGSDLLSLLSTEKKTLAWDLIFEFLERSKSSPNELLVSFSKARFTRGLREHLLTLPIEELEIFLPKALKYGMPVYALDSYGVGVDLSKNLSEHLAHEFMKHHPNMDVLEEKEIETEFHKFFKFLLVSPSGEAYSGGKEYCGRIQEALVRIKNDKAETASPTLTTPLYALSTKALPPNAPSTVEERKNKKGQS